MDHLEKQLKQALERRGPSSDFTARVMAQIAHEKQRRAESPWWQPLLDSGVLGRIWAPAWQMAMAGTLAVVLLAGAGLGYREYAQRQRALAARDQIMQALQITGTALNRVSHKVHRQ